MRHKSKIKAVKINQESSRIKPSKIDETEKVSFNFCRLQNITGKFDFQSRQVNYFNCLISKLREISKMNRRELTVSNKRYHCGLRCHPIDFSEKRVTEDGFNIPGNEELNDDAWEFSLSQGEHGRAHGYFIGNIYYIVWLDPDHNLYK